MGKTRNFIKKVRSGRERYYKKHEGARYSIRIKSLIFLGTMLLCTFFLSVHYDESSKASQEIYAKVGSIWRNAAVVADFTFPVLKEHEQYSLEVKDARSKALPVYKLRDSAFSQTSHQLDIFLAEIQQFMSGQTNELKPQFAFPEVKALMQLPERERSKALQLVGKNVIRFFDIAYKRGVVNTSVESIKSNFIAVLTPPNNEVILTRELLVDSSTILDKARELFQKNRQLNENSIRLAIKLVSRLYSPNLVYSETMSKLSVEAAEKSVARTEGIVSKGETIIATNDRVTNSSLKKLNSYKFSRINRNENIYSIWFFVGSFGHAAIIYSILLIYLFFIRKRIFYDNFLVIILSSLVAGVAFMSWLSIEIPSSLPIEFFILLPAFSMLAAIVFDSRTAFYVTITMALMLSAIRGNDYDLGISMLFAGTLAAYTVRDIQSRTQMFKTIFFIYIGIALPVIAIGLERSSDLSIIVNKLFISVFNAALSPMIAYGVLFILEHTTNITTDLKLQEYDDLKHPLLTKLGEIAPGTYQHTLSVVNLAEQCALAINANPLLTRLGALFHDIGKLAKPEYFVENQINIQNKHDQLSPKKSAEAIRNHVIEGVKIGKEYKLPQRIIDFIPMHHGTSLIKHFYAKAIEEAQGKPIDDNDFRYSGPKPNSKETAIVMIADSCEALSKLHFKDNDELEAAIEKNIKEKLLDGQFNDSNLTMKELKEVKDTCIRILVATSHSRIEYMEIPENKAKEAE